MKKLKKIKVVVITGTRPELIKVSVLLRLLQSDPKIELIFIHSGQHYDENMFEIFIKDLDLFKPDYNVKVGSYANSIQTGKMLISFFDIIKKEQPDVILSQGDTNTVFAAALTAFKNDIPFGHIEAGIRSFDLNMPEEINRILTGVCTRFHFAPTKRSMVNLLNEGVIPKRIFLVGNTVVDAVLFNKSIAEEKSKIDQKLHLKIDEKIILLTVHRPSNVDQKETLSNIFSSLFSFSNTRIIFPIHPRTKEKLIHFGLYEELLQHKNLEIIEPIGYLDMLKLMSHSYLIVTDSGGLQEEAVILKKPCLTLRTNTERPESIEIGANILVGNNPQKIKKNIKKLLTDEKFYNSMISTKNPFGDGTSSKKIIDIIKRAFHNGEFNHYNYSFFNQIPYTKLINVNSDLMGNTVESYEIENSCIVFEIFNKATFAGIIEPSLLKISENGIVSKMSENSTYSIIEIRNTLITNMEKEELDLCILNHKNTLKYFEFIRDLNPGKNDFDLLISEDRIIVSDRKTKIEVFVSDLSVVENNTLTTYNEEMFELIYENEYADFVKNWMIPLKSAPGKFVYFTCKNKSLFISVEDEETLSNKIEIKIQELESNNFRFKFPKTMFKILNILDDSEKAIIKLNRIISKDDLITADFGVFIVEKIQKDSKEIYGHISISD